MQPNEPQTDTQPPVVPQPSQTVAPVVPVENVAPIPVVSEPVDTNASASLEQEAEPDQTGASGLPVPQPIQWQSPEYIEHARPPIWFVGFWGVVVLLMIVAAVVIKSWSFTVLVPVMAAALMIYSHRPPRVMNYVLSEKGVYINDQLHPMSEFRSFGVLQDEAVPALMLIPVKRFRPGLTVYFPQENGEAIVDLLGARIPMQNLQLDAFDKIVRKLRI